MGCAQDHDALAAVGMHSATARARGLRCGGCDALLIVGESPRDPPARGPVCSCAADPHAPGCPLYRPITPEPIDPRLRGGPMDSMDYPPSDCAAPDGPPIGGLRPAEAPDADEPRPIEAEDTTTSGEGGNW